MKAGLTLTQRYWKPNLNSGLFCTYVYVESNIYLFLYASQLLGIDFTTDDCNTIFLELNQAAH